MSCETCKSDVAEAARSGRLMSDMVQSYDRQNRRLWIMVLAQTAIIVVMAFCMFWAVQNIQRIANEAVLNALNTVAEMEVTQETTTVTQDTGDGDGNAVYQAGEHATYTEGGNE